jgi:hypothetical protein
MRARAAATSFAELMEKQVVCSARAMNGAGGVSDFGMARL